MTEWQFEPIDLSTNASLKLDRLIAQADAIISSEHPNIDSKAAAIELKAQAETAKRRLSSFSQFPANLQNSLLRQANFTLTRIMELLGFIVRSTATRNLFELYFPFREISQRLVGQDVRLIISSDWRYSPFTYPFGLEELPKFVLIGLPASESENALVFPTAGHELGHNIWRAKDFKDKFQTVAEEATYQAYEKHRADFEMIFQIRGADIRNDMFVQPIIYKSLASTMRQLEEIFCDAVGAILFGASYLYAFDYLIAPTVSGRRSGDYPNTKTRVEYIQKFSSGINLVVPNISARFTDESFSGIATSDFIIRMADDAVGQLAADVFGAAYSYVARHASVNTDLAGSEKALSCFEHGRPVGDQTQLGALINAAWAVYNDPVKAQRLADHGVDLIPFLTDLVIKSAENLEFASFRNA
ncbi:hypothetical protein GGC47_002971 [Bosea sp. OAE752]|jgi:hypothetical protein|uniref:hypothetical protein n=1 Tax=Bosea sp. OAE752 TaxID=2663873 RepID=UPI001154013C